LQEDRKSTQRARLLCAIRHVAVREGYAAATIAQVISEAGVSRPTFYDYFSDKDDCFLAALADTHRDLLASVGETVASAAPEQGSQAAITALVGFAVTEPEKAHFLMNEPCAGGALALDARDAGITEIAQMIEQAHARVPTETAIADFSPRLLIGTIYRLVASRLRHDEREMDGVLEELLQWLASYSQPVSEHRWIALAPGPAPAPWPLQAETALRAPPPLPPGRPRKAQDVLANQRQRILLATAQATQAKGYTATTIAYINKLAGVDHRVFASCFADKQEAFMAIHELGFQRTMAVTASAFFAGESWPERIWEAGRAFTQFFEQHPAIAHIGFVESYAVGSQALKRVEEVLGAFTIFLQEGYQYGEQSSRPSSVALQAIAGANFEIAYQRARAGGMLRISGLLPHVSFISLAPFLGPSEANRFIDQKLDVLAERTGDPSRQRKS
jgi:AcrR family transcriptional regulator